MRVNPISLLTVLAVAGQLCASPAPDWLDHDRRCRDARSFDPEIENGAGWVGELRYTQVKAFNEKGWMIGVGAALMVMASPRMQPRMVEGIQGAGIHFASMTPNKACKFFLRIGANVTTSLLSGVPAMAGGLITLGIGVQSIPNYSEMPGDYYFNHAPTYRAARQDWDQHATYVRTIAGALYDEVEEALRMQSSNSMALLARDPENYRAIVLKLTQAMIYERSYGAPVADVIRKTCKSGIEIKMGDKSAEYFELQMAPWACQRALCKTVVGDY